MVKITTLKNQLLGITSFYAKQRRSEHRLAEAAEKICSPLPLNKSQIAGIKRKQGLKYGTVHLLLRQEIPVKEQFYHVC